MNGCALSGVTKSKHTITMQNSCSIHLPILIWPPFIYCAALLHLLRLQRQVWSTKQCRKKQVHLGDEKVFAETLYFSLPQQCGLEMKREASTSLRNCHLEANYNKLVRRTTVNFNGSLPGRHTAHIIVRNIWLLGQL